MADFPLATSSADLQGKLVLDQFEKLTKDLEENMESSEQVLQILEKFSIESDKDFHVSETRGEEAKCAFLERLLLIIQYEHHTSNAALVVALNAVRICLRERSSLSPVLSSSGLSAILFSIKNYQVEQQEEEEAIQQMAIRTLTNALCDDAEAVATFISIQGLDFLLNALEGSSVMSQNTLCLLFRLLYMLSAQNDAVSNVLIDEVSFYFDRLCVIFSTLLTAHHQPSIVTTTAVVENCCKLFCTLLNKLPCKSSSERDTQQINTLLTNICNHLGRSEIHGAEIPSVIETLMFLCPISSFDDTTFTSEILHILLLFLHSRLHNFKTDLIEDCESQTVGLVPILVVLNEISSKVPQVKITLKEKILLDDSNDIKNKLLTLMTSFDTLVKRYVSEFLFILCDEDTKEFIKHTKFGNAVGLLKMKGLM